jgi:hypothetical protein
VFHDTNLENTNLPDIQPYLYEVRAFDASTNVGPRSSVVTATPAAPTPVDMLVWRFRNTHMVGNYLWTPDLAEKASIEANLSADWALEGSSFTVNTANSVNNDTMWRFKNKNVWTYFYTADPVEMQAIKDNPNSEWSYEGPTYKVSADTATAAPVWRFQCLKNPTYLWTADPGEMATIRDTLKADYKLEGVSYYIGQ